MSVRSDRVNSQSRTSYLIRHSTSTTSMSVLVILVQKCNAGRVACCPGESRRVCAGQDRCHTCNFIARFRRATSLRDKITSVTWSIAQLINSRATLLPIRAALCSVQPCRENAMNADWSILVYAKKLQFAKRHVTLAILSCDKVARQNRAIKLQVWHRFKNKYPTERRTDGRTPDRNITLTARRGQRNNGKKSEIASHCHYLCNLRARVEVRIRELWHWTLKKIENLRTYSFVRILWKSTVIQTCSTWPC